MASSAFLVFKMFRGRTPEPPFQKCVVILQSNKRLVEKVKYSTQGVNTHAHVGSISLICDLLAEDLLYPLSVKYRGGKGQDPGKNARKFNVNLLFVFIRISVKQPLLSLK